VLPFAVVLTIGASSPRVIGNEFIFPLQVVGGGGRGGVSAAAAAAAERLRIQKDIKNVESMLSCYFVQLSSREILNRTLDFATLRSSQINFTNK
jgi:hypothetical protein